MKCTAFLDVAYETDKQSFVAQKYIKSLIVLLIVYVVAGSLFFLSNGIKQKKNVEAYFTYHNVYSPSATFTILNLLNTSSVQRQLKLNMDSDLKMSNLIFSEHMHLNLVKLQFQTSESIEEKEIEKAVKKLLNNINSFKPIMNQHNARKKDLIQYHDTYFEKFVSSDGEALVNVNQIKNYYLHYNNVVSVDGIFSFNSLYTNKTRNLKYLVLYILFGGLLLLLMFYIKFGLKINNRD